MMPGGGYTTHVHTCTRLGTQLLFEKLLLGRSDLGVPVDAGTNMAEQVVRWSVTPDGSWPCIMGASRVGN